MFRNTSSLATCWNLPLGKNKKYLNALPSLADKIVSGWGIDGVTTFQDGFPVNINASSGVNLYGANLRPNVVAGCKKETSGSSNARVKSSWINAACFTQPPAYTFGNEPPC